MKAIHVASPSGQKDFFCDEAGASAILQAYRRDRGVQDLRQTPLENGIRFDAGGAVLQREADIEFEANGIKFLVAARQFFPILETLRGAKTQEKYGGCVVFGGWMGFYYLLSPETRAEAVKEMERIWPSVELKVRAEEDAFRKALQGDART